MDTAHAACLCRDLQLTLHLPSKWVAHCHCSMCRRAHGAGYVTWVGMRAERCDIDDPQQRLTWFTSSPGAERGFCSRCGSTLLFRAERWPGELHVTLANVDGPVDRAPQCHAFWDTHVDWASIDPADGLPRKGG